MQLAHVVPEDSGKSAVRPGVRHLGRERAVGGRRSEIHADAEPRRGDRPAYIVLAHREVGGAGVGVVGDDQVEERVVRILVLGLRDLVDAPTLVAPEGRVEHAQHQHARKAARRARHVFGPAVPSDQLPPHPRADGGIAQPHDLRVLPSGLHPVRNGRVEAGGRRDVGVTVGPDLQPGPALGLEQPEDARHPAPVGPATQLEVPDLHWEVRLPADGERLFERRADAVGFVADVAGVYAAVPRRGPRHGDQLGGLRVTGGRVDQRGRDA